MNPKLGNNQRRRTGFTIIELLVSVGVTALLVGLMLTIVVNVLKGWNRSAGTLTSGNQARLVLDQLSRDLQSAVIKRDNKVWFAATIQQNQPTSGGDAGLSGDAAWPAAGKPSNPAESFNIPSGTNPVLEDYRFGQAGVWLRFITSVPDTNAAGNLDRLSAPRAVSYQIIRLPVVFGSSETRYQLFRSEVSPTATFAAGYDLFDAAYNNTAGPVAINDAASIRFPEMQTPNSASRKRQLILANNVIDFGVRILSRNSSGQLVVVYPLNATQTGFAATTNTAAVPPTPASGALGAGNFVYDFPEVVEVFVRVLTDEGALQIYNLETGKITSSDSWWDIAIANSRVYTRRIEIKSKSL